MATGLKLHGAMIPRTVKRLFDQRAEQRTEPGDMAATLQFRGREHPVRLVNRSASGAMIAFSGVPHIGETVAVQSAANGPVEGRVQWVRDGQIGIHFTTGSE